MIYNYGTVSVTQGSVLVEGLGTEFLKNVSPGSIFSINSEIQGYLVSSIIDNLSLRLSSPYLGLTQTLVQYTINSSQTSNLGLPLLGANDPDTISTVNNALTILDKRAGDFLSFTPLKAVTLSGENVFYIDGKYPDELCIGRVIKFLDVNAVPLQIDTVQKNFLFDAYVATTPVNKTFTYYQDSGEQKVKAFDVLQNITQGNYAFVKSVNTITNEIVVSGEFVVNSNNWEIGNNIRVYGGTKAKATIHSYSSGNIVLQPFFGEAITIANFAVGKTLYNYTNNEYKNIVSMSQSGECLSGYVYSDVYTNNWSSNQIVYIIQSEIAIETQLLTAGISSVQYGARSQIGSSSVNSEIIDFGQNVNQVNATKIPCQVVNLDSTLVSDALFEITNKFHLHENSGELAHRSTAIPYTDDLNLGPSINATNQNAAINELKLRFNSGIMLSGVVDLGYNEYSFYDESYEAYPTGFFDSTWYCLFNTGVNTGQIKELLAFNTGVFTFNSGEAFTYTPQEGDSFNLIAKLQKAVSASDFHEDVAGDIMPPAANIFEIDSNLDMMPCEGTDVASDDNFELDANEDIQPTI